MNVLAFVFSVAMLLGTLPAPSTKVLSPLDASSIDAISVDITVEGYGAGDHFHAAYRRRDRDSFVAEGNAPIAQHDLEALIGVLNQPPQYAFDLSRSAIQPALLTHYLDAFERGFLGPKRADPAAKAEFDRRFLDYAALERGCRQAMESEMMVTDYYPHLSVVFASRGETVVTIEGRSQREFFLPILIVRDGVETTSVDPLITSLLGALLPAQAPLKSVMEGDAVLTNWASFAAAGAARKRPFFECASIARPYAPYPVDEVSPTPSP